MNMSNDPDATFLKEAGDAVVTIDVQYRLASYAEQAEMRDKRDNAFSAYAMARNKLLAQGVIATDADIAEMRSIAAEVKQAADTASLVRAIGKAVTILARVALA
jgi:hypothetical protein